MHRRLYSLDYLFPDSPYFVLEIYVLSFTIDTSPISDYNTIYS